MHYMYQCVSRRCTRQRSMPGHGGNGRFFIFKIFCSKARALKRDCLGFDPAADRYKPNDLEPVAEPLSACFPTCKRAVTASTSILAWSGGCVTIYLQRSEECQARSKCGVSCFSWILRNCLPKRFFCASAQAAASLPQGPPPPPLHRGPSTGLLITSPTLGTVKLFDCRRRAV